MAVRQWTVVVLSDDAGAVRQFRLSRRVVHGTIACALLLGVGLVALGAALGVGTDAGAFRTGLMASNQLLEREFDGLYARLDTLQGSLEQLTAKDEYYRLLAGLEPLDADVLLAGVGGPDADSLEASLLYAVDSRAARQTFAASTQLDALIRRAGVIASSWNEAETALSRMHTRLRATPSILPTRGHVSSAFSAARWHPILDRPRAHKGIDIVAASGTPVVASASGRVTASGRSGDYGLLVEIDHGHGVVTRYAHLAQAAVKIGQSVQRGQTIGAVGTSGLSAGPHLHYEVLLNGRHANPRGFILESDALPD